MRLEMDAKEKLLSKESADEFVTINVKDYSFKVRKNLTGIQLFHIEKLISEQVKNFPPVYDDNEVILLPEEIRYVVCLLYHIVIDPKLSLEEWALVFQRKPHVFLVLARRIAEMYFGDNNLSSFFSEDMLSNE